MNRDDAAPREWSGSEVAVIGMTGRFPGAPTVEQFWENLKNGRESIRFFTDEEMLAAGTPPSRLAHPALVKANPMIDDVEWFDAALFNIPPHEAQLLDPQQRLFLECAWEALERAGYNGDLQDAPVGVYAGLEMNNYLLNLFSQPEIIERAGAFQFELANDKDYVATRVAYKLNLRGPSFTVQCACSTSLVAIHLACQSLLTGDCDLALAGGVSLKLPQLAGYLSFDGGIQSPDGHCRAFDAAAQGTVFGSGLAVVVLKRLSDALADGDTVHAVIKGSAINNDGSNKIGYSAPGPEGQYQVIRAAQLAAEVDPETITYVEAHGTATAIGDPIEVSALTRAFRATTEKKGFCAIGSVKTNVGHLRSAAGVTSLIKATLALAHRQIPASLHFQRPNPQIDFAGSPFYVNARLAEWPADGGAPRRAAVNSFGVGGTNAHVILEEAPPPVPSGPARPWQLLVLSANTPTALAALRDNLSAHLLGHTGLPLADAAFTLQVGRRTGRHRGFLVARDLPGAAESLAAGRLQSAAQELRNRPVDFLFPGQGAQYPGMGRELYETEPAFRDGVDHCCEILRPLLGLDLREALYPRDGGADEAARRLERTALAQPALFVVEHSLARLWMSWGVRPRAMLGHSLGEYVAACLAGVFPLEDALALVAERGRLMQALPAGAMLAVPLPESAIVPLLAPELSLAAVNGPARTVVSGPETVITALEAELARRGTAGRRLHTSHAFHSGAMDAILAPFAERVRATRRSAPDLAFVSNLTGTWITREEAVDPGYWARHLRGTVRFADGLRTLTADSDAALLEVGPGQTLASFARQGVDRPASRAITRSLPHPKEAQTAAEFLLAAVGQLWLAGVEIDWQGFHAGERRHRVELPTYPFERQRYWVERRPSAAAGEAAGGPLVRKELSDWFYVPSFAPSAAPEEPTDGAASRWLLLADDGGIAEAMARRIAERGSAVALVSPGEAFAESSPGRFTLAPRDRAGWTELFARLRSAWGGPPDRVVYLWSVGGAAEGADGGFLPFLWLAQELARQPFPEPAPGRVQLRAVTTGLQAVGRGEAVTSPERATLLGPVRTLPLEHPEIGCAAIDVEAPAGGADRDRLAELLIAETAAPAAEPVVALRGEERWVERFEPVPLSRTDERRLPLRQRGVYLITGGLGGLGLVLAEELARSVHARLVLTGRGGLPPREEWQEWLAAHGESDPTSRRLRGVLRLEELGAEVLVVAADVADEAAGAAAVRRARERFGPIQGAIHAAGVPGGGVIQLKTAEAAQKVLAPKLQGTRSLAAALADEPLDFLVLCSSIFGVTGGIGQVDYCAANSFLDAFAHHHSARGVRTVAIGWGGWQEVGMAVDAAAGTAGTDRGATPPAAAPASPPAAPTNGGAHPLPEPLLARRVPLDEGGVAYTGELSPDRHWILAEHRIAGTPTMPGTSYLEIARAAYTRETGAREVEIFDVAFVSPLLVAGGSRETRVVLTEDGGATSFRIESRAGGHGGETWQEHARGGLRPLADPPARRDVAAIAARCALADQTTGLEAFTSGNSIVFWGPRWQSLRRARAGTDEALIDLELPAGFAADLETFGLHPALLDVATAFGGGMLSGGRMLPASYGRVRYRAPLPGAFLAHLHSLRRAEGDESLTLDLTLMTPDGEVLVEIGDFVMRRLAEGGRRPAAARAPAASAGRPAAAVSTDWIRPLEGVEAFRRLLSRGRFAQLTVSPLDLNRTIAAMRKRAEERSTAEPAPRDAFPRPSLETAYVPAATETEALLAEIWKGVLGLDQVGSQDNFFDLGGDSVIGIQIVARSTARGLQFSPEQLFEHQTIAELAKWLSAAETAETAAAPFPEADVPLLDGGGIADDLSAAELEKIFSQLAEQP